MADEAFLGAPEGGVETLSRAELQMHVKGGGATGGTDSNPKAW